MLRFPGCIGCPDLKSWTWNNFPKALQGVMVGKDGKTTLIIEVVCDLGLCNWSLN